MPIEFDSVLNAIAILFCGALFLLEIASLVKKSDITWRTRSLSDVLRAVLLIPMAAMLMSVLAKVYKLENVSTATNAICSELKADEAFATTNDAIDEGLDPQLRQLLAARVEEMKTDINDALIERRIEIQGVDRFRPIYLKAFQVHDDAQVIATSRADSGYFWPNQAVEAEMLRFIKAGGRITRIFYVRQGWEQDAKVQSILKHHANDLNVTVKVVEGVPVADQVLFVSFGSRGFGWQAYLNGEGKPDRFMFTRNESDLKHFSDVFLELRTDPRCKTFGGPKEKS